MALGAIFSWACLPDVQRVVYDGEGGRRRLETRNLEELGEGFVRASREGGQVIGVGNKIADLRGRVRERRRRRREGGDTTRMAPLERVATGPVEVDGNGIQSA